MTDEAARKAILSRRARFLAATLAGVTISCGAKSGLVEASPAPEVDAAPKDSAPTAPDSGHDAGPDTAPLPCLDVPIEDTGDAISSVCLTMDPDAHD